MGWWVDSRSRGTHRWLGDWQSMSAVKTESNWSLWDSQEFSVCQSPNTHTRCQMGPSAPSARWPLLYEVQLFLPPKSDWFFSLVFLRWFLYFCELLQSQFTRAVPILLLGIRSKPCECWLMMLLRIHRGADLPSILRMKEKAHCEGAVWRLTILCSRGTLEQHDLTNILEHGEDHWSPWGSPK